MNLSENIPCIALAGLDPATHVFFSAAEDKDVDPRVKPGGGGAWMAGQAC